MGSGFWEASVLDSVGCEAVSMTRKASDLVGNWASVPTLIDLRDRLPSSVVS